MTPRINAVNSGAEFQPAHLQSSKRKARPKVALGRCGRDHLSNGGRRQALTTHGLCRPAGGQAGRSGTAGDGAPRIALASGKTLVARLTPNIDVGRLTLGAVC